MGEFVRVERDGAIATIRLDRPPMNALSTQVQDELAAAAGEAGADPAIRAVVVYGGGKVFAAGADIKELASASYPQMAVDSRRLQAAFTAVAKIPKPVVAAVTGYALGGGLELALCADFRVAGEGARLGGSSIPGRFVPAAEARRNAQFHREWAGEGHLHRALTLTMIMEMGLPSPQELSSPGPVRRRARSSRAHASRASRGHAQRGPGQQRARRRPIPGHGHRRAARR